MNTNSPSLVDRRTGAGAARRVIRRSCILMGLGACLAVTSGLVGRPGRLLAQEASPEAPPSPREYAPAYLPGVRAVGKPWLGVGLETRHECRVDVEDECRDVVVISSVVVGSPAEQAGIEVGDILTSIDAARPGSEEFKSRLDGMAVGRPVAVEVARSGRPVRIEVVPQARPLKPVQVKARPSAVWAWMTPEGEVELPIVIESGELPQAPAPPHAPDDNRYVVIVPSEDGWRVQVLQKAGEAEAAGEGESRKLEIELRDLQLQMEDMAEDVARAQAQAKYWGRVKAELTPEMAALRDSVLSEARAKLAEVRKARSAYREEPRVHYRPSARLAEVSRRIAGAEFEPLGRELRHEGLEQGLLVLRVIPGTPAFDLGLRRGDVVVEVGGSECTDVSDLREALVDSSDEKVTVRWMRKGVPMSGSLND